MINQSQTVIQAKLMKNCGELAAKITGADRDLADSPDITSSLFLRSLKGHTEDQERFVCRATKARCKVNVLPPGQWRLFVWDEHIERSQACYCWQLGKLCFDRTTKRIVAAVSKKQTGGKPGLLRQTDRQTAIPWDAINRLKDRRGGWKRREDERGLQIN